MASIAACNPASQSSASPKQDNPLSSKPRLAKNLIRVEFDHRIKPVTHVASGALYGVVEHIPEDLQQLVTPLQPSTYLQPALAGKDAQQPYGNAVAVAERLTNVSDAKVTIRLADVLPGWPYEWTNWQQWQSKVMQVINSRQHSNSNNYYGYEIWNEPDVTWQAKNGQFNRDVWLKTYQLLKQHDPQQAIIGPSFAVYEQQKMREFLLFCKQYNCLPDVISWHQLQGVESVATNVANYRATEKELGIAAKRLSINEYSHDTHEYEGAPGVSVPFIAKFERHGVESANISWWFPALPGRLGSLLTANNQKNGGWWLYKWYGDMQGDMVKTVPPDDNSDGLDAFANIDLLNNSASIVLGGNFTGTASVNISGLPQAFGDTILVKTEHVVWDSKESPVNQTITDSVKTYDIEQGEIKLDVVVENALWGYRLQLTPQKNTNLHNVRS
ncbi:hypothetical protein [Neptunicella marina]|uniref:hypothetical protein n=1 Tax=Neptunicella marina TaxID=2125989 RepID=UPI0019D53CAF|nr:hypothetical protein [Neptunicella marina]